MATDYISQDVAVTIADYAADKHPYDKDTRKPETYSEYNRGWNDACDYIRERLEGEKPADVEPVRRMAWKPLFESEITGWNPAFAGCDPIGAYVCSCCNSEATYTCNDEYELSNYCPNCGAKKMDLEGENDG